MAWGGNWFFLVGDYLLAAHRQPAVVLHGLWVLANLALVLF